MEIKNDFVNKKFIIKMLDDEKQKVLSFTYNLPINGDIPC